MGRPNGPVVSMFILKTNIHTSSNFYIKMLVVNFLILNLEKHFEFGGQWDFYKISLHCVDKLEKL